MDRRTGSGRCCSMWESRLVSESITHHPNMTSPLGDSLCLAPTIYWKGTSRTCEINGAQPRTIEPMRLTDWCTRSAGNVKLWFIVMHRFVRSIRSGNIPPYTQSLTKLVHCLFPLITITTMYGGYQFTSVI